MIELPNHLHPFFTDFKETIHEILQDLLLAVYIHGSLTYGVYLRERSDIDVMVILTDTLTAELHNRLSAMFANLSTTYPEEVMNLELDMVLLGDIEKQPNLLHSQYSFMNNTPKGPKPLVGFWIELATTRELGINLFGPTPTSVIPHIDRNLLFGSN
ncbi:hypothetical protein GEMRC1_013644 [Eukaryota sp. GEM-RC1]